MISKFVAVKWWRNYLNYYKKEQKKITDSENDSGSDNEIPNINKNPKNPKQYESNEKKNRIKLPTDKKLKCLFEIETLTEKIQITKYIEHNWPIFSLLSFFSLKFLVYYI